MPSTSENDDTRLALLLSISGGGTNAAMRAYLIDERQWVMTAMPRMPTEDWERYMAWIKSAMDPLPKKGTWAPLKSV